jgi:hypothetical protein
MSYKTRPCIKNKNQTNKKEKNFFKERKKKKDKTQLNVVAYTYNPSTWETEAGGSRLKAS